MSYCTELCVYVRRPFRDASHRTHRLLQLVLREVPVDQLLRAAADRRVHRVVHLEDLRVAHDDAVVVL